MVCWVYKFADGAVITLVNTSFSIDEVLKLEELHGKCEINIKRR